MGEAGWSQSTQSHEGWRGNVVFMYKQWDSTEGFKQRVSDPGS